MSIELEQARQLLLAEAAPCGEVETLPLLETVGRIAAADAAATMDAPPFPRSPLDGYAVYHGDITHATVEIPVTLPITETIYAGDMPKLKLNPGQTVKIATGAPIPEGADCVIKQEIVTILPDSVRFSTPHKAYQNYCFPGEDVAAGDLLALSGMPVNPVAINALAGQGISSLKVYRKPRIGILSTGSELFSGYDTLTPGKIYDSNSSFFASMMTALNAVPVLAAPCSDEPGKLAEAIDTLLANCDAVITTGGVSVGARDYLPQAGDVLGAKSLFHGLCIKPGGAVLGLKREEKYILCLSGNPLSAFITFQLLAVPLIKRLAGYSQVIPGSYQARFHGSFPKAAERRRFLPAIVSGGDVYLPDNTRGTGRHTTAINCNCLIDMPAGTKGLADADIVEVIGYEGGF